MLTDIFVRDKLDGIIHRVGADPHDSLYVKDRTVFYFNLQNGCGTMPNGSGEYEFVDSDCGSITLPVASDDISFVDAATALRIIVTRRPRNIFVQENGERYLGIDNRTGDAWVKEFTSLDECLKWLSGEKA